MNLVVDLDDFWSLDQLVTLRKFKAQNPDFRCTVYAIPGLLGPIRVTAQTYPWITFGIHGFFHTFGECIAWTDDDADYHISRAIDWGYAPIFKAPNWIVDDETESVLAQKGIVLHAHNNHQPTIAGLKYYKMRNIPKGVAKAFHTHLCPNPSTDYLGDGITDTKMMDAVLSAGKFLSPFDFVQTVGEGQ